MSEFTLKALTVAFILIGLVTPPIGWLIMLLFYLINRKENKRHDNERT